jgi:hypothetical protein
VALVFRSRLYEPADERGWFGCRVLSFLDAGFFGVVERQQERYERQAVKPVTDEARL